MKTPRRLPSIRIVVGGMMLLLIVVVAAALLTLLAVTTRRQANHLAESMTEGATARVRADTERFLDHAVRVSDLYTRRIAAGGLPTANLQSWERAELDDLVTTPDVASICFGNAAGDATWVSRVHNRIELGRAVGADNSRAVEHVIDPDGRIDQTPIRVYQYDPRKRPWYPAATGHDGPVWTPIYSWFADSGGGGTEGDVGTGYARAIRAADGSLVGVLVIDVTLGGISTFLKSLPLARVGSLYIVDDQNRLVAASDTPVLLSPEQRAGLGEAQNPSARAVAAAMLRMHESKSSTLAIDLENGKALATVEALRPRPGMDWRIVAVVPESAYLGEAAALQNRARLFAVVCIAASLLLGIALARRISLPLVKLARHSRRIGAGEFDARVEVGGARELVELSHELNTMAGELKHRVDLMQSLAVAMEVQQSLLPQGSPLLPGLDIAGRSRYCDQTGGDYFDFIETSDLPDGQALIAVGDVMGHGIAAALLMATARAALRAHASRGHSLADLLTRVNEILSRDARHGRFMTMSLLVIDPAVGTAAWASAGHDPPIVYDPIAHKFIELEGGDLPLGIDSDTKYQEFFTDCLRRGWVIVIGTDGIWEAANAAGKMFGKDRLREVIRQTAELSSTEIVAAVEGAVATFCGDRPAADDITLVVVRLANPHSSELARATARAP